MRERFEEQWLSGLPSEWVEKRADFLCDPYRITVDPGDYEDDLVAHYSIPQVQDTGGPAIERASDISSTKLLVNDPMLLVSKLNPRKQTICIAEPHEEYATLASSEFVAIRSSVIDQRYAFFLWSSQKVTDRLSAIVQSATRSHQRVNPSDITKLPWKWPPLDVQRRIAGFLDEKTARIDALIAKKRALLERLAEKRQALITRAVTQGLDPDAPRKPSGIDWLGEIPAHWEVGNIRRFATMKTGHTPSRSVKEYWDDCTIPWFTLADVWQLRDGTRWWLGETAEKISELGLANSAAELLPAGTVVLSRTASVGYSGIMPAPMATSQDFWNWICGPKLTPEYLLLLFRSMRQKFEGIMSGSTHQTIYQGVAAGLEVCLPPLEEQQAIATYVRDAATAIDTVVERVRHSIAVLTEYRSALVTAAVTGRVGSLLESHNDVEAPSRREVPNAFKRAALAAHIADRLCDEPTFGRVKFQKVLHLCEMHAGAVEVEGNYFRQAAGPLDSGMMHSVHSQLKKQGWFDIDEREGARGYLYRRGAKVDAYRKHFDRYFGGRAGTINELLALLAGMTTEQSEIVSTVYAAWNDLLLEGRDATPDAIVHLVLNEWAEEKRRIPEDRWRRAIEWMRAKALIPRGTGAHTRQREA